MGHPGARLRIRLSGIRFRYRPDSGEALRGCDLDCDAGRITVLMGQNGAGKSTLIRLLTGQLLGYAGEYRIDGELQSPARGEILHRNRIGYMPDAPALESRLTGEEMIRMAAAFRGLPEDRFDAALAPYRERFEMGAWLADRTCSEYSKGMAKKVSLAMAFIGDPAFHVLDEPFDGLDPLAVIQLKRLLEACRKEGRGALVSSHALDAAEKVADDVVLMRAGAIAFAGDMGSLRSSQAGEGGLEAFYLRSLAP
jgi:ABC-2 type transport system ATP-binding protein